LRLPAMLVQNVALAPLNHVDSEHLVVNQAAAKPDSLIRMLQLNSKALQQLVPNLLRDIFRFGGINVLIKNQRPEQHLPVLSHQVHQPLPVKPAPRSINDVADIGAIKTLASCDEDLGGNQLFRSQNTHGQSEDVRAAGPANPGVVNAHHPVAHAGDQVYKEPVAVSFGQPDWVQHFSLKMVVLQHFKRAAYLLGGKKE